MTIKLNKSLYSKEAVIKASYSFTDKMYIHIDVDDMYYIIMCENKPQYIENLDEREFVNEVLMQMTRQIVRKETKNVRELMLARAFSSTVIEKRIISDLEEENDCEDVDINSILTDWFDTYE